MLSSSSLASHLRIPSSSHPRPRPRRLLPPRCAAATVPKATLYDVLGVPAAATGGEIKAAYRRLARSCHPDVLSSAASSSPADEFIRVHAAYATLSDPERRAEYDRRVMAAPAASAAAVATGRRAPFCASTPWRTWETDQCW